MNDNMQFIDPEAEEYNLNAEQLPQNEPYEPPPPPSAPFPSPYQYAEQVQYKQDPSYRRRKPPFRGILIGLVLLLIVGIGAGVIVYNTIQIKVQPAFNPGNAQGDTNQAKTNKAGQTIIPVTTHPTLVIYNNLGSINVHAGQISNQMLLKVTGIGTSSGNNNVSYTQTSDKSTVIMDNSFGNVNLDLTVPATTDLKLTTNQNNIEVTGVSGQMVLTANNGSITVNSSTINGPSLLNGNTGDIVANDDTLSGQITVSNNQGGITLHGSLNAQGAYQIKGNGGLLDVTITSTSSFHVDATNNNGKVTSDFPGVHVQNSEIHADVGKSPRAMLTLYNNGGSINLHAQKGA
jgi:hypothetical protein